jgi:Recombination endonuclease VII
MTAQKAAVKLRWCKMCAQLFKTWGRGGGNRVYCQDCMPPGTSTVEYQRRVRSYLARKYNGMTLEEYEERERAQGGKCAICCREDDLQVDHCHDTGAVRGLLCGPCNRGLACFEDNPMSLLMASQYLEKSREQEEKEAV